MDLYLPEIELVRGQSSKPQNQLLGTESRRELENDRSLPSRSTKGGMGGLLRSGGRGV